MTFNVEEARKIAGYYGSKYGSVDRIYWAGRAWEILPAALDEIEQLRAERDRHAARIAELESRLGRGQVATMQNREAQLQGYIKDLRGRIAELEERLIEDRAEAILRNPNKTIEISHDEAMRRAKEQIECKIRSSEKYDRDEAIVDQIRKESIDSSNHIQEKPKMVGLTKEQRAALETVDALLWKHASEDGIQKVGKILYDLRASSPPAWEATDMRRCALEVMADSVDCFPQLASNDALIACRDVLRAMLEEVGK